MTRLLVYGTLRKDERAHAALKGAQFITEARVPGFDMFALYGFPGVVENKDNKEGIVGEVYDVDENTMSYLDFYEGFVPERPRDSHFVRQIVNVNEEATDLYVYNHDVEGMLAKRIPSGNWKER
jgi:gamma-glutamylcyclotransferase (GGCT)/AIG2-like uncharacterized protein YtfP